MVKKNLELLGRALLETSDYYVQAEICNSLVKIGGEKAGNILKEAYIESRFVALKEGFLALVELGDKDAVGVAINRISPSLRGTNSGLLISELEKATGQSFGYDRQKWQEWYQDK